MGMLNPNLTLRYDIDPSSQEHSIGTTLAICIDLEIRFINFLHIFSMFYIIHDTLLTFLANPALCAPFMVT